MRFDFAWFAAMFLLLARSAGGQSSAAPPTQLRLPRIFADGMVLQRDQPIPVWGWAAPGHDVIARFGRGSAHARANARGAWWLELPAQRAGGPWRLFVRAGSDSVILSNVLIGDVWVASGQSNMDTLVSLGSTTSLSRSFKTTERAGRLCETAASPKSRFAIHRRPIARSFQRSPIPTCTT